MRKNLGTKPFFYPLPVLIIGSYDEKGKPDLMNAAWGGLYEADKVILSLSQSHQTTENIKVKKAFTISFADKAHLVSAESGFHVVKSEFVDAPLVIDLPVALECTLIKVNEDGSLIGKIENVSIDESALDVEGNLDMTRFAPLSFEPFHRTYHVLGEKVGTAFKDGGELK